MNSEESPILENDKNRRFQKKRITKKEDKVTLQVLIPRKLYEELVRIAPEIYGSTKGALSAIVEEALRLYLAPRTVHTAKHTNPKHRIRIVYEQVLMKLREYKGLDEDPRECMERELEKAIMDVRGVADPRSIEKWKKAFERSGLIKFRPSRIPNNRIVELL